MPRKEHRRRAGAFGLQASTIGFVLVGCTAIGFGAGWWLDQKFGTAFWMPLLSMLGVAAGFAQMLRMLGEISEAQRESRARSAAEEEEQDRALRAEQRAAREHPEPQQKPIFRVPPPPAPSWETKDAAPGQDAVLPENAGPEDDLAELDTAALLRKLSGEVDEGEANADEISESGESRTEQSRTGTNRADGTS